MGEYGEDHCNILEHWSELERFWISILFLHTCGRFTAVFDCEQSLLHSIISCVYMMLLNGVLVFLVWHAGRIGDERMTTTSTGDYNQTTNRY